MSQENVETVRRGFAKLARSFPVHELEGRLSDGSLAEFFDPEVEWIPVTQSVLATGRYHGYDGVRRFWIEFLSPWDEYDIEAQELFDRGDQVAVVMRMRGRTHEVEIDEIWSSLYDIRDGRIIRVQAFTSRVGALEAAGLSE
jgi:ketosteroid isomerase-like protein